MEELMDSAMHRHDISDHAWSLLAPLLPGRRGAWGGRAKDNRLFVNAIFWILRTGAPWRDLPPEYGGWKNRFREQLKENDVQAVIPPIQRGNRSLIEYDKYLYKMRHIIGNTFLSLKQWRAVATRYAKRSSSFLAAVQVRCIALWCKIL